LGRRVSAYRIALASGVLPDSLPSCSLTIPPDHLDLIAAPPAKQKQMPRVWISRQNLLGLCSQAIKPPPHIHHPSQIFASVDIGIMPPVPAPAPEPNPHQRHFRWTACAHFHA